MEYVEIARAESERGELVLRERRDEAAAASLELRVNGVFVMDTLETSTERALASAALELVEDPRAVVVGGLGLGFTMHEVLADARVEQCAVVEIEQSLVDWMRDGTIPARPGPAGRRAGRASWSPTSRWRSPRPARRRTTWSCWTSTTGPATSSTRRTRRSTPSPFLTAGRAALRPGGALVVWSADAAPELEAALREVFGEVEARRHEVLLQDRDEQYWLYVARVPSCA